MVKETSTSREALRSYLDEKSRYIRDVYGIDICFVEIIGRRWSYLAGRKGETLSPFPPRRITLTDRFGIVSDGWENIPVDQGEIIISSLKEALKAYE